MKTFPKIARPIVIICSILAMLASIAFLVFAIGDFIDDFEASVTFLLIVGNVLRTSAIVAFALVLISAVCAYKNGLLRVVSTVAAVFSVVLFICGLAVSPICSKQAIYSAIFGGGKDMSYPTLFGALSAIALWITTGTACSMSKKVN